MSRNFPKGEIFHVEMQLEDPPWLKKEKVRGVRRQGQLYELRVHREFSRRYPGYLPSPWFQFRDVDGSKWCQPDGLIVDPRTGLIVVVEAKLKHTNDACRMLFGVYVPVVRALFGGHYRVEAVEVCQWYDPAVFCDQSPVLCKWPGNPHAGKFNVHICDGD